MTTEPPPVIAPVIAIDGPSGSGKGTIASDGGRAPRLAPARQRRPVPGGGLLAMDNGIDLDDGAALAAAARATEIRLEHGRVWVDGADRSDHIRTEAVSEGASRVAAVQAVRDAILDLQRAQRRPPGLVADGRDMGTVVFPDASLKVFLDATAEVRAERRYNQLKNKGLKC
jgi:cytidylate kinase